MKKILLISLILLLSGCAMAASGEDNNIYNVFKQQIKALEDENTEAYLKTMDKKYNNPDMKQELKEIFEDDNLKYKIKDISLKYDNKHKVCIADVTIVAYSFDYGETEIKETHRLEKQDGQWRITDTEIQERTHKELTEK